MQSIFFKIKNFQYKLIIIFTISLLFLNNINLSFASQYSNTTFLSNIDSRLLKIDSFRTTNAALSQQLLEKFEADNFDLTEKQQHYLTYLRGWNSYYQNDYLLGEQKLTSLLTSNASDLIKFRANYTLVNAYSSLQRWQQGLQQVAKVLTSSVKIKDIKHYQTGLITIISFYNQVGQYQLALDYSKQLINNPYDDRIACMANQLVLLAKLETKLLTLSNTDISKSIQLCEQAKEPIFMGRIRSYQAQLHLNNNDADKALNSLKPYLVQIQTTQYKMLITRIYNLLTQAYYLKGDIKNTKKYALLAQEQGGELPETKEIAATYQLLYKIAELGSDYKSALLFHKKYSQATQHYLDEVQSKQLAFQLANHNNFSNKNRIEQQDQKIDLLNIQHLLTKKKAENSLLLIILLVVILIALALWSFRSWLTQQHMNQLTEIDNLTKVNSREHFIQLTKSLLNNCRKTKKPLTCILFDLDDFKKINDNYGNTTGDNVLKEVTKVCSKIGRQDDVLGRLSGEEFAYILPGCSLIIAEDIANRCRLGIQNIDYQLLGLNEPITASFGVSDCAVSGFQLNDLLSDAYSAMYMSKEQGKDCVSIFT